MAGDGRLTGDGAPVRAWSDRHWDLLKTVESVADKLGVTMAQVAINWVATQPGIASAIVGASSPEQLRASMKALDFELPDELRTALDEASVVPPESVYRMFTPATRAGWSTRMRRSPTSRPATARRCSTGT